MNIVKPYATLMDVPDRDTGVVLLKKIEWCGRISHRSEDAQLHNSWDRFIRAVVLQHGDWSIVEHASATVDFLVDRGVTHELVRHRLCAFTQESTRFVNYEKKMPPSFIEPFPEEINGRLELQERGYSDGHSVLGWWGSAVGACEEAYKGMLALGVAPQIARSVFPNALASRIVVTSNLRNWRHILLMRTTKEAHPQMREVMIPLLFQFQERIPILFEDIEPNGRQVDAIKKGR